MTHKQRTPPPPFKHVGGKYRLATWIAQYLPHTMPLYTEAFCGAASVYIHIHHRCRIAALNDADQEIINLFRVLQDPQQTKQLLRRLTFTPYAKDEFVRALNTPPDADPVTRAWSTFVKRNQGFSGKASSPGDWGRARKEDMPKRYHNQVNALKQLAAILSKAQIDNNDAISFLQQYDCQEATHYIDPPYLNCTNTNKTSYKHDVDHQKLVDTILSLKGNVVLSCYDHPTYAPLAKHGFTKVQRPYFASVGIGMNNNDTTRIETLYVKKMPRPILFTL